MIAFQDHAWGDGEIFAEYQCSPGVVVDRYQEGDQWKTTEQLTGVDQTCKKRLVQEVLWRQLASLQ